jgi:serine/threonine protein kinase
LTGRHPFPGRNTEVIQSRIRDTPPTPGHELRADIPEIYQSIIDKALTKNYDHRYKTGADMAGDLSLVYDFIALAEGQPAHQEKFNRVHRLEFFADFSNTELWGIINAGDWSLAEVGDPIALEGDETPSFYVLLDGEVTLTRGSHEIVKLGSGDCFGEMGIVPGRHRTATIEASTAVTVLKLRSFIIERASINCQLRFQRKFLYTLIERLEYSTDK